MGGGLSFVLAFVRPNGWCTVINFGTEPIELTPEGKVLVTSAPLGRRPPAQRGHRLATAVIFRHSVALSLQLSDKPERNEGLYQRERSSLLIQPLVPGNYPS